MNVEEAFLRVQSLYGISYNLKEEQFHIIKAIFVEEECFLHFAHWFRQNRDIDLG